MLHRSPEKCHFTKVSDESDHILIILVTLQSIAISMVPEHRKIELCCSVVLFAFFPRFPAPSSLVQIQLRIKTQHNSVLSCRGGAASSRFQQSMLQFNFPMVQSSRKKLFGNKKYLLDVIWEILIIGKKSQFPAFGKSG